jgi:protein-arginine kinase activator protein McsA
MCDKPMDCSKCKRKAEVFYKEMQNGEVNSYKMCKSCPLLKAKLDNETESKENQSSIFNSCEKTCPVCGLRGDEFTITLTLGCEQCAETFKDILSGEIVTQDILPGNIKNGPELDGFHFGNIPKTRTRPEFSKNIETLHLALNEAVLSEHFEDAADIRDQIQKHLENPNAGTA